MRCVLQVSTLLLQQLDACAHTSTSFGLRCTANACSCRFVQQLYAYGRTKHPARCITLHCTLDGRKEESMLVGVGRGMRWIDQWRPGTLNAVHHTKAAAVSSSCKPVLTRRCVHIALLCTAQVMHITQYQQKLPPCPAASYQRPACTAGLDCALTLITLPCIATEPVILTSMDSVASFFIAQSLCLACLQRCDWRNMHSSAKLCLSSSWTRALQHRT